MGGSLYEQRGEGAVEGGEERHVYGDGGPLEGTGACGYDAVEVVSCDVLSAVNSEVTGKVLVSLGFSSS